jgi:ribosomal protein S18 acetylase RimI-like enzyme
MSTLVRRLTPADASLARQVTAVFHGRDIPADYLRHYLTNPNNYLFVAEVDGELTGFLTAHRLDRFNRTETQLFIYEIETLEPFRRRGVGSALMNQILEMSRTEKIEAFVFTNHSNTVAVQFYKSLGGLIESGDELMFEFRPWESSGGPG